MKFLKSSNSRRNFFKKSALFGAGIATVPLFKLARATPQPIKAKEDNIYLIGPQEGFSPQIGTLLSTMTMMRSWVVRQVENLSQEELDFQLDDKSNSIGALLLHLAATEKYYQLNTFEEMQWGSWSAEVKKEWDVPMYLGKKARKQIKGNDISYYLEKLEAVRADTIKGFAARDDEWIMKSEPFFDNQPTNNHCKWFHVCEHESNHNGQIKMIKKRFVEK
ncbi:MAG: DinB family protein [Bacteroidota bacterium]